VECVYCQKQIEKFKLPKHEDICKKYHSITSKEDSFLTPARHHKSQRFNKIKERFSNPHHNDTQCFKKIDFV